MAVEREKLRAWSILLCLMSAWEEDNEGAPTGLACRLWRGHLRLLPFRRADASIEIEIGCCVVVVGPVVGTVTGLDVVPPFPLCLIAFLIAWSNRLLA